MAHENERLQSLDYLRGLAAISILAYHYGAWNFGTHAAGSPLGRLGVYGVAIFYVLSGLTMRHVYFPGWQNSWAQVRDFMVKRAFRIYPLLWLAIALTLLLAWQPVDAWLLFLDTSGLFAFLKWESNYALGAWSIGNELAFYTLFPLMMVASKAGRPWLLALAAPLLVLYGLFAWVWIDPSLPLADSWITFSNPLNQAMLFMSGVLIGEFTAKVQWSAALRAVLLVVGLALLFGYPAGQDPVTIVTGFARLALTLGCVLICIAAYRWQPQLPRWLAAPLAYLGEASYGVYILHPIFYNLVEALGVAALHHGVHIPVSVRLLSSIGLTLLGSHLSYRYFERPMMRLGRRLASSSGQK